MKTVRLAALLVASVLLILLVFLWLPMTTYFPAQPQPAQDYAAAMTRIKQLQAKDGDDILPECNSLLLTHGETMTRTIIFFHGISNCPAQFAALGKEFYAMGYNVLIPRLPYHGLMDRMTDDLAKLTAEDLIASADEAVDIAAGLGEQVTVVGFSTGGVLAAWVVEERPEVDKTVLISPFLSPKAYPPWVIGPLSRALLILPNQFWWWDDELKEQLPGPRHTYPRYASHAIAQIMRLSLAVRRQAHDNAPQSQQILMITNAGQNETVDNRVAADLMAEWHQRGEAEISSYEFESNLDLDHDYIDPGAPAQSVNVREVIYPILIEQIHGTDGPEQ